LRSRGGQPRLVSEYLEAARQQLEDGVGPQTLVLVFRAAEEAEQRRDVAELEEVLQLAGRVQESAGADLRDDADRLIALCGQLLERARAQAAESVEEACPECGRPLPESAVRCRSCGTLLV